MSRLIDADVLKARLDYRTTKGMGSTIAFELKYMIDEQPTAQPERKTGRWIGGDGSYVCSECSGSPMDFINTMGVSFDAYVETPMNYCPNCGADMRGGDST